MSNEITHKLFTVKASWMAACGYERKAKTLKVVSTFYRSRTLFVECEFNGRNELFMLGTDGNFDMGCDHNEHIYQYNLFLNSLNSCERPSYNEMDLGL